MGVEAIFISAPQQFEWFHFQGKAMRIDGATAENVKQLENTTLRYESMWTRQGRVYLRTYENHESQYSVYIGINILASSVL